MSWLDDAGQHRRETRVELTSTEKTIITVVVVYAAVTFGLLISLIRWLWS